MLIVNYQENHKICCQKRYIKVIEKLNIIKFKSFLNLQTSIESCNENSIILNWNTLAFVILGSILGILSVVSTALDKIVYSLAISDGKWEPLPHR